MVTSIADLLDQADRASRRPDVTAGSAAAALMHTGRLLGSLPTEDDQSGSDQRWNATVALSTACQRASLTFDGGPGRLADLAGVVADAAGRLHRDLNDADRWSIAISAAFISRRCETVIAASGPYQQVPQLRDVLNRSRDVIRTATHTPPDPELLSGIRLPITGGGLLPGLPPGRVVLECTAGLLAHFRNRSRDPMTTGQLLAACHAAEHTYRVLQYAQIDGAGQAARAWQVARAAIFCLADVPDRRRARWSPALEWTRRLDDALLAGSNADLGDVEAAASYLPRLATGIGAELHRIQDRVVIGGGPRPLTEQRVGDWLRHRIAIVTSSDLAAIDNVLERAASAGRTLVVDGHGAAAPIEAQRLRADVVGLSR